MEINNEIEIFTISQYNIMCFLDYLFHMLFPRVNNVNDIFHMLLPRVNNIIQIKNYIIHI